MRLFSIGAALLLAGAIITGSANAAPVTTEITHKIMRSDGSRVAKGAKHEFNGGSHVYGASLAEKRDIKDPDALANSSVKKGWVRLFLDWPTKLRSIVIHKASVGKDSFKGGYIELEVQNMKGKWISVFKRNNKDIDSSVSISNELRRVGPVKGARLLFTTPFPLTVGPIDLNG